MTQSDTAPIAIITGGAGGMGLATAEILARDHRVLLADLDERRLDEATARLADRGVDAATAVCDITDRSSVDAVFSRARSLGALRAVVHTAGVSPQMGRAEKIIRINALGTVYVTEAALAAAVPGSALVNVSSIAGHLLPSMLMPVRAFRSALTGDPDRMASSLTRMSDLTGSGGPGTAYSLSKAFVIWYSERMAAEFGRKSARILSVSPGSFDTEMGRLEKKSGSERMVEFAALKRFGTPEEIAELLAFCVSAKPGYLTGTDILCDGGNKAGLTLSGMLSMARGR
ncbi:SDR family NAD(P)-dependent oxidoreductase [Dietzia sp. UBA5065]|jgi:NAD(P)-dependent dehydrogenase (short-subunit alcohol dehydrogenase family)|uniref:SDR family NAD(P)-dependent oxidoreductase n=1 Tax=Dietzia sp. UBA5065 TaxID=1946422 RepID=UPI0025C2EDB7|nr:SDR family oxidoreductase [Dietzia sp. UBA5065]HMT50019.1 SDR family oxidoreductase [Dietzia sp.]